MGDSAGSATLAVDLKNTGKVAGDEVIFAYVTNESKVHVDTPTPIKSLVAFQRTHVKAGESKVVSLTLEAKRFALVDSRGVKKVVPGQYKVQVDRGQDNSKLQFDVHITGKPNTLF